MCVHRGFDLVDGVQGKHLSVASGMELGGRRASFSLSPTAHYTRSNDDVIYYLHGCIPITVPLEPCSTMLNHTPRRIVMLCSARFAMT